MSTESQGKPVLILQGTRQEGYTDPAMAAQDAMVTRARTGPECVQPVWERLGGSDAPAGCVLFQVLWEACQQKTGAHKTMLQMILCNKSYQQLWLGEDEWGLFPAPPPIMTQKTERSWGWDTG